MTEAPTDDQPGFIAEGAEHCHDCYRLIRPGQTYFVTMKETDPCWNCGDEADRFRATQVCRLGRY
jgi:hypothetical protein